VLILGNDIVDFCKCGINNKSQHQRFMERVFNEHERKTITSSENPDVALWLFWSAKETAFKVISKISEAPVFSHKKFETALLQQHGSKYDLSVTYNETNVCVEASATEEYVHATGFQQGLFARTDFKVKWDLHKISAAETNVWQDNSTWQKYFSEAELQSIHHPNSALIRYHCKISIAKTLHLDTARLQILRQQKNEKSLPPFLLLDEKKSDIDISLSHHGDWLAWCFSFPVQDVLTRI